MIVYGSLWNVANFCDISQYIIAYYLDFIQLQYILLTFGFTFGQFKSLPQNFGLFQNGSKILNFRLGNGVSWKSQYRIYLVAISIWKFSGKNNSEKKLLYLK